MLKFNVKLRQSWAKAKAYPKLIPSQSWSKSKPDPKVSQSQGYGYNWYWLGCRPPLVSIYFRFMWGICFFECLLFVRYFDTKNEIVQCSIFFRVWNTDLMEYKVLTLISWHFFILDETDSIFTTNVPMTAIYNVLSLFYPSLHRSGGKNLSMSLVQACF